MQIFCVISISTWESRCYGRTDGRTNGKDINKLNQSLTLRMRAVGVAPQVRGQRL